VVARDETEQGERTLLNFGHTFGHALEVLGDYGTLVHGEAVAIGMVLAAEYSADCGLAPAADADRLRALLQRFGLPVALPTGITSAELIAKMRLDKKALAGQLRLILWQGIGRAFIAGAVDEASLQAFLENHAV
jgi:3-dehydroquinate synthase